MRSTEQFAILLMIPLRGHRLSENGERLVQVLREQMRRRTARTYPPIATSGSCRLLLPLQCSLVSLLPPRAPVLANKRATLDPVEDRLQQRVRHSYLKEASPP